MLSEEKPNLKTYRERAGLSPEQLAAKFRDTWQFSTPTDTSEIDAKYVEEVEAIEVLQPIASLLDGWGAVLGFDAWEVFKANTDAGWLDFLMADLTPGFKAKFWSIDEVFERLETRCTMLDGFLTAQTLSQQSRLEVIDWCIATINQVFALRGQVGLACDYLYYSATKQPEEAPDLCLSFPAGGGYVAARVMAGEWYDILAATSATSC